MGMSNSSVVEGAVVRHFAISAPVKVTAGSAFIFTVTAQDQFNNTVIGYIGTVHFTTSAAKAVLPANYTFTGVDAGTHTFSAILRSAGTQSITTTATMSSSIFDSKTGVVVNPAPNHPFVVSRCPSPPTSG